MTEAARSLRTQVARAAAWSGMATIVLRLSGMVVGIVLARILTPEQFGVFAVAITVQGILMTVADLGLSADIIRSDEPGRIAPTVAALGLISGGTLALLTIFSSQMLAGLLGSPQAAPAIAVMGVTLLLGGLTVVPYAMLLRRFQQRELFIIGVVDFVVSTAVTLTLVALGFGVLGLAIGRVSAQVLSTVLQFSFARVRPRFALDRTVLRPVLTFSLPIAAANLFSWVLLNVDNIVLARVAGVTALGFYVLAFNISSWPMSALAAVVRSIALPYFARAYADTRALATVTSLVWGAALPAGAVLAVLSAPIIEVVYGSKWLPAAPVLAALGVYGALRVVFDLFAGYLYARGSSRPVLWVQIVWLVALVVGMYFATLAFGIVGAGWVHVGIAIVIVLPGYLIALRAGGVRVSSLLAASSMPTFATVPAVAAAFAIGSVIPSPLLALVVAGVCAVVVYLAICGRWMLRRLKRVRGLSDVDNGGSQDEAAPVIAVAQDSRDSRRG